VSALGYTRDLQNLRDDLAFEEAAVKRYGQMAAAAKDPRLRALFEELARGEAGHRRGLRRHIALTEEPSTPVVLFCPLCGWDLDFGPDPQPGATAKCRMCPGKFALRLDGGDWVLERIDA
jgi:rubrerythrin